MITLKTIENHAYKNCVHVYSECGYACVIKNNIPDFDNKKASTSKKSNVAPSRKNVSSDLREGEIDLSRFLHADDDYSEQLRYFEDFAGNENDDH